MMAKAAPGQVVLPPAPSSAITLQLSGARNVWLWRLQDVDGATCLLVHPSPPRSLLSLQIADGYVPSYNLPADPWVYNISGVRAAFDKYGPWFSYERTARAQIFARNASAVRDLAGFQRLMRYNDFKQDPISSQGCSGHPPYSAENAVAARDDLNDPSGTYPIGALGFRDHLATDAKLTSAALHRGGSAGGGAGGGDFDATAGGLTSVAQSGPTYDQQPVFDFRASPFPAVGRAGMPDVWRFPFVDIAWPLTAPAPAAAAQE
jgi:hypothetical protein